MIPVHVVLTRLKLTRERERWPLNDRPACRGTAVGHQPSRERRGPVRVLLTWQKKTRKRERQCPEQAHMVLLVWCSEAPLCAEAPCPYACCADLAGGHKCAQLRDTLPSKTHPSGRDGAVRHQEGARAPWAAAGVAGLAFAPDGDLLVLATGAELFALQRRAGWAARLLLSAAVRLCFAMARKHPEQPVYLCGRRPRTHG